MSLDGRKDIQYVKSARSVLHAELKARVLTPRKMNTQTHRQTQTHTLITYQ